MITDPEYEAHAQAIVDAAFSGGPTLVEGVIKCAAAVDMNPNETARLIEATNVCAHLSQFKCAGDSRYIQFDVVDPAIVEQRLFGKVPVPSPESASQCGGYAGEKTASAQYDSFNDWEAPLVFSQVEKIAADALDVPREPMSEAEQLLQVLSKKAEVLDEISVRAYDAVSKYDGACGDLVVAMKVASDLGTLHRTARDVGGQQLVDIMTKTASAHRMHIMPEVSRGLHYTETCRAALQRVSDAASHVRTTIKAAHALQDLYRVPRTDYSTQSIYGLP